MSGFESTLNGQWFAQRDPQATNKPSAQLIPRKWWQQLTQSAAETRGMPWPSAAWLHACFLPDSPQLSVPDLTRPGRPILNARTTPDNRDLLSNGHQAAPGHDAGAARYEARDMTWPNGAAVLPIAYIDDLLAGTHLASTTMATGPGFGSVRRYLTATATIRT